MNYPLADPRAESKAIPVRTVESGNHDSPPAFARGGVVDLKLILERYPRTIGYSIAGFLIGGFLDMLPVVGWVTGGTAKFIGLGLGAGLGMAIETNLARWVAGVEALALGLFRGILTAFRQRSTKP